MSFAGLRKQFNKANQYVSEKIGGAKGTELDDEFLEMERKTDAMGKLIEDILARTHEYLQPNAASRAKLMAAQSISKIRGQAKTLSYPQPEGTLGEALHKGGRDFGEETVFGQGLVEAGEAFKMLADIKYALEDNVKQNFLEPLNQLQTKDLKEVNHHRKKLSGRRLDYDCKKRKKEKDGNDPKKGSNITDEELIMAEEKFEESKVLAETAMNNLLENEIEQISQLTSFVEAQLEFHKQSADVLKTLLDNLEERRDEAANRPRKEHIPKRVTTPSMRRSASPSSYDGSNFDQADTGNSYNFNHPPAYSTTTAAAKEACCEALYDFVPENEGELGFSEGSMITLISKVDSNWYEGSFQGQTGYFPVNYVKIVVDLP